MQPEHSDKQFVQHICYDCVCGPPTSVLLANSTCTIINIMTALIFIIVSRLHALFLVVAVRSLLHALVVVAVKYYFQQEGVCAVL